jgi:hypothetical protein
VVQALSIAPSARAWLDCNALARVLHVFDRACNLIAPDERMISLVTPAVGDGPFNLVVPPINFSIHVTAESHVASERGVVRVGNLVIDTTSAEPWEPRPAWKVLHQQLDQIRAHIPFIADVLASSAPKGGLAGLVVPRLISDSQAERRVVHSARSSLVKLVDGLHRADTNLCAEASLELAGLGIGLTPDGDDLLIGSVLAARIWHPGHLAEEISQRIAETAVQRTMALSAEWLRSAARGECAWPWHALFEGLLNDGEEAIREAVNRIIQQGHTSGSSALAGFVAVLA